MTNDNDKLKSEEETDNKKSEETKEALEKVLSESVSPSIPEKKDIPSSLSPKEELTRKASVQKDEDIVEIETLEEEFKKTFQKDEVEEETQKSGILERIKDLQEFKEKLEKKEKEKTKDAREILEQLKALQGEFSEDTEEAKKIKITINKLGEEIEKLKQIREEVLDLEEEATKKLQ